MTVYWKDILNKNTYSKAKQFYVPSIFSFGKRNQKLLKSVMKLMSSMQATLQR